MQLLWKIAWRFPKEIKITFLYDLTIYSVSHKYFDQDLKELFTLHCSLVQFTIIGIRCPSMDEQNKEKHKIDMQMRNYSDFKKKILKYVIQEILRDIC